jgi:uncharacterized YigZ family protein
MSLYSYHTIQDPAEGIYKEKGSKFLAFAYPVISEADIKEKIETLKKEYFDARHHCFAWMLGPEKRIFRAFDDGEPNHSAGDPILGQIRSKGLTNILIVVVRYFGGVKLGVGGLIAAYKAAAESALSNAEIVEMEVTETFDLSFDYGILSDVMKVIKELGLKILEQDFGENGRTKIAVPVRQKEKLVSRLELMQAMGKKITWAEITLSFNI